MPLKFNNCSRDSIRSGLMRFGKCLLSDRNLNLQQPGDFARHHCWLIDTTGKPHLFFPVDQAQEHNVKGNKVTYCSEAQVSKWEYIKKLHPAIYIIYTITEHIERKFGTKAQGQLHTLHTIKGERCGTVVNFISRSWLS